MKKAITLTFSVMAFLSISDLIIYGLEWRPAATACVDVG